MNTQELQTPLTEEEPHATPAPGSPPPPPPSAPGHTGVPSPRMRPRLLAGFVALAVALAGGGYLLGARGDDNSTGGQPVVLRQSNQAPPVSSLASMIKRVLPSVVNVRVTSVGLDPFGGSSPSQAQGSGAVIDRDGVIVTNNHVVAGATRVEVVFNDEHDPLEGTVVGTDPAHDLAVIKVDADDLTPITLGRSGNLELGDTVVALGFPLNLGGATVTRGIVSGLDRTIDVGGGPTGLEHLEGVLQTDAAINPGNSGGALVDANGNLIGINTAAASAENIGFAIAIDEAMPIVRQILSSSPEAQAWLGVQVASVESSAAALQAGFDPDARGALVVGTIPGSPAAGSGIREGDLIVGVDDMDVSSSPDLTEALAQHEPGDRVEVRILGSEGEQTVPVTLSRRPATFPAPNG